MKKLIREKLIEEDIDNDSFLQKHTCSKKETEEDILNRDREQYIQQGLSLFYEYVHKQNEFKLLKVERMHGLPTILLEQHGLKMLLLLRIVVNDIVLGGEIDKDFLKKNPDVYKADLFERAKFEKAVPLIFYLQLFPFPNIPGDTQVTPSERVLFKASPTWTNYFMTPVAYIPYIGDGRDENSFDENGSMRILNEDKSVSDYADEIDIIGKRSRYNDIGEEYLYDFAFDWFKQCVVKPNNYKDFGHLTIMGIPFFLLEINEVRILVAVKPYYNGRSPRNQDKELFEVLKEAATKYKALPFVCPINLYDFDDYRFDERHEIVAINERMFFVDLPTMIFPLFEITYTS